MDITNSNAWKKTMNWYMTQSNTVIAVFVAVQCIFNTGPFCLLDNVQAEQPVLNAVEPAEAKFKLEIPAGLPKIPEPEDNPLTAEKIELGKLLYFDTRLSRDKTISCASCHDPEKGWSNDDTFATGFNGAKGDRNSPTIINSAYSKLQFWDGRANSLEDQALGPIQNPIEMNMTLPEVIKRLKKVPAYQQKFKEAFGKKNSITEENLAKALAAFERTILSGDAPYDKYVAGDKKAMSEAAIRGKELFFGKAVCSSCHSGPNFTDNAFHNLGVGFDKPTIDIGREKVSKLKGDRGAFKTPTLREIKKTGPYMHDGSHKTLKEVVEYYNKGGTPNDYLDEEIFPLELSKQEIEDLVTFMEEGLSSKTYPNVKPPKIP